MINKLIAWALKTVLGRWVTGIIVASLLGGVAYKWYDFKDDLRDEGAEECVQEINQATVDALQAALADEMAVNAELHRQLVVAAEVNEQARARRNALESRVDSLLGTIEEQRRTDETYRTWADSDLPDGVVGRLREAAGSQTGSPD